MVEEGLVPRLRFPEFRGTGGWDAFLGDALFDQITNKDHNSDLPVLAITQEQGAVPRELIDYHVSVAESSIEGYKVVEVGDFIISLRSFQGGIEYSRYRGICSPAYVILRLKPGHIPDYFRHLLKTDRFIAQMTKNLEGLRDGKMVSFKQFSELRLSTPEKDEQEKIAACLSSLDDLIAAETKTLDTLKVYKKGLMQHLFPQLSETVPRLRFPEFRGAGEWEVTTLGEVSQSIQSGTSENHIDGRYPLYGSTGLIGKTNNVLSRGDVILVARVGANAGKANLGRGNLGATDNTLVVKLRDDTDVRFVLCQIESLGLERLRFGSGQPLVTGRQLKDLRVLVPSFPEQTRIATCLAELEKSVQSRVEFLDKLRLHKVGLFRQLFPRPMEEQK